MADENLPVRTLTDEEALEWLLTQGQTSLVGLGLAWGWNEMRLARRLRAWEAEGLILRSDNEIIPAPAMRVRQLAEAETTEVIPPRQALPEPAHAPKSPGPISVAYAVSRGAIGLTLVGLAFALVWASVRANAWVGFALSADEAAGQIFATLSVVAELIAFVMPTANRLYRQAGDRWTALRGSLMTIVASGMVFFAASGFVLINVSDKAAIRSTPAVEVARKALDDIKAARDRECVKLGPVCRLREDAVVARQHELIVAMTAASADPQATALGIDPATLRLAQAVVLVGMCLLAGLVLSHGWGLVFRR